MSTLDRNPISRRASRGVVVGGVRIGNGAPIVVFTHRPLFDLKPEWEWFTSDGADVMNALAPYENVTVLYGHIHRQHFHQQGNARLYAARSLIFAFPDPATTPAKKPAPFDKTQPFKNLGLRMVNGKRGGNDLRIEDVELTMNEFSGTVGSDQTSWPRRCSGKVEA